MDKLTEEEKLRFENNLTVVKGKTLVRCLRLLKLLEDFGCDDEEKELAIADLEDRIDINVFKMVERRRMTTIQAPVEELKRVIEDQAPEKVELKRSEYVN